MIDGLSTGPGIKSALDNHGEMSRLRSKFGIRISPSPTVGTYIISAKIRRILSEYARVKPGVSPKKIDRLTSKLDRLGKTELEYLFHLGTEESVADMISMLKQKFSDIHDSAYEWKGIDRDANFGEI